MDEVNQYIEKAQELIESALKELQDVKLIQVNDPTDYPYIMHQLVELDEEINEILTNASPEQRQQLEEAQQQLRNTKTFMIRGI